MAHHTITASDGTRLCFDLAGPQWGAGILLCHGLCAGGAQFAADADWLATQGYRVLVPDLRGHGRSGVPSRMTSEAFSPQRLRADLMHMLDQAGLGRVHWVGNSLGGILGLGVAAEAPQRLVSLTIFGTALALNLPAIGGLVTLLDTIPGRALAAQITARMTTDSRTGRPLVARLLKQYDARAVASIVRHIRRYDLRQAARNWSGPGLILVGSKDHAVNRALLPQLTVLDGRPNWRIEHLPRGGHCANLDASVAWRRAILTAVAPPVAG